MCYKVGKKADKASIFVRFVADIFRKRTGLLFARLQRGSALRKRKKRSAQGRRPTGGSFVFGEHAPKYSFAYRIKPRQVPASPIT